METPLISVVIPVYNQQTTIVATIQSVLNQTYQNLEVWVVDDGSDQDIASLVKGMEDERINYVRLKHTNANVARNYGIMQAAGEYIAMLDGDDYWKTNHLETSLSFLRENQVQGIYGSLIVAKESGQQQVTARLPNKQESMFDYLLTSGYGAQTSTLFMTTESARTVLWDTELRRHQDYDFVVRYTKIYPMAAKKEATVIYRVNNENSLDFTSCIQCIQKHRKDIAPSLYVDYHINMYMLAKMLNEPSETILYYKQEAVTYKKHISYFRYILILEPRTRFLRWWCKFVYLWGVIKEK